MQEKAYPYEFSVVMPIYQAKEYIDEALDSLIHQTIGFEKIQLILVDDGSTDGSAEICDRYQERYPKQVKAVHKENGGLSSARNTGLLYAEGRYVNFCDPDDYFDRDAFEKVSAFMRKHDTEVDLCSVPLSLFGDQEGPHGLNIRYEDGTRVIDLMDDANAMYFQLHAASAFYKLDVARTMDFDPRHAIEDGKENMRILLDNPKLGVVSNTNYNYRKHGDSITGRSGYRANWYFPHLRYFSEWLLDRAEEKYGYVPKFVQHAVMYDLQWKIRQKSIPDNILTDEEVQEYKELLYSIVRRIDDDVILAQKSIGRPQKTFILSKKYGRSPEWRFRTDGSEDADLCFNDTVVISVSEMRTVWEFVSIDNENHTCTLEGYHTLFGGLEEQEIISYLVINDERHLCDAVDRIDEPDCVLGERISWKKGFRITFPLQKGRMIIRPEIRTGQNYIQRKVFGYGQFFPVTSIYRFMKSYHFRFMLKANESELEISRKPILAFRLFNEIALLCEIWHKNDLGGRKAVGGRLYYHLLKPFKRRQLWIVSDRISKADDNGEALFCYLMKNKPPKTRIVFAISKNCEDGRRLAQIGPCVDAMSFRHKLLHLLCDVNVSAQADRVTVNPYAGHHGALRDLLTHQHFVFLQHGITKDDISSWLNRYNKNMSGFVAAAVPEYESLLDKKYAYPPEKVWLTGFPRFDRLYHKEEKKITLMPTWRKYLMSHIDSNTGIWIPVKDFYSKDFYLFYNGLLNSERLLSALEKYGYTLQFFPHPNLQLSSVQFNPDPRVTVLPTDTFYRDIYATSKLIITDYSSAVFDFAYLRKPVLYCQFDKDEFFAGEHVYTKGYFDYERDGFGEVTYDLESTIDRIIEYAANDCRLKDDYRDRTDRFFAFDDQNNCRRVTERILQLQPKQ